MATYERTGVRNISLRHTEAGTSLLELIGALAAGLVVLGATLQSLSYFQQEFSRQQGRITQQQDLRLGLELLEQELRLAGAGSLSSIMPDEIQFSANIHGLMTNVTAAAAIGQTTIAVDDGLGWPDRKSIRVCWNDQCEPFTLARAGQRNLLTLMEPIPRMIPAVASVVAINRVRYYSRPDETGALRFLRQVDGGFELGEQERDHPDLVQPLECGVGLTADQHRGELVEDQGGVEAFRRLVRWRHR